MDTGEERCKLLGCKSLIMGAECFPSDPDVTIFPTEAAVPPDAPKPQRHYLIALCFRRKPTLSTVACLLIRKTHLSLFLPTSPIGADERTQAASLHCTAPPRAYNLSNMSTQRRLPANPADAGDEAPAPSSAESSPSVPLPTRSSALPVAVQFPLVAVLSFSMASLGYSLLGEVTKGELAAVSRSQETWEEVGLLAGWRG